MPKSRHTVLIVLNVIMLIVAIVLIATLATIPIPHSTDSSHAQFVAQLESVSDIPRLRSMISRDDEYIRTLEDVSSQWAVASRAALILFSVFAASNLVLLFLPLRTKQ